jgi:hypothetical protein
LLGKKISYSRFPPILPKQQAKTLTPVSSKSFTVKETWITPSIASQLRTVCRLLNRTLPKLPEQLDSPKDRKVLETAIQTFQQISLTLEPNTSRVNLKKHLTLLVNTLRVALITAAPYEPLTYPVISQFHLSHYPPKVLDAYLSLERVTTARVLSYTEKQWLNILKLHFMFEDFEACITHLKKKPYVLMKECKHLERTILNHHAFNSAASSDQSV